MSESKAPEPAHGLQTAQPVPQPVALPPSAGQDMPGLDRAALQRVVVVSVLAGLCPLIPLPFLDDFTLDFVRRRGLRAEFEQVGLRPTDRQLRRLTDNPSNRLSGCVTLLLFYPLKKVFRKVFFVLAIKDCVDAASGAFHEQWLLHHALRVGLVGADQLAQGDEAMVPLREAIEQTCKQVDTRPANQALRLAFSSGRTLLVGAARDFGKGIRDAGGRKADRAAVEQAVSVEEGDASKVGALANDVGERMWAQRGYLLALQQRLERNMGRP